MQGSSQKHEEDQKSGVLSNARTKLQDTHGFVLAEQVISIVFLGLLCVVIGAGLTAAFQSYRMANESTRAHELLTRAVAEVSDDLAFAHSIEGTGADCAYVSPTTNTLVRLGNDETGKGIVLVTATPKSEPAAGVPGTDTKVDSSGSSGGVVTPAEVLFIPSSESLEVVISAVECINDQNSNTLQWSYRIDILRTADGAVLAGTDMVVAWIG